MDSTHPSGIALLLQIAAAGLFAQTIAFFLGTALRGTKDSRTSPERRAEVMFLGWAGLLCLGIVPFLLDRPSSWATALAIGATAGAALYAVLQRRILLRDLWAAWALTLGSVLVVGAPYLLSSDLLIYFHPSGSDLWGYLRTADYLRNASFSSPPTLLCHPENHWIHYVLGLRDRPLAYLLPSFISWPFQSSVPGYFGVLAAALASAAYSLSGGLHSTTLAWLAALSPTLLSHFYYQFYAGALAAALVGVFVLGLIGRSGAWKTHEANGSGKVWWLMAALWPAMLGFLYAHALAAFAWGVLGLAVALAPRPLSLSAFRGVSPRAVFALSAIAVTSTLLLTKTYVQLGLSTDRMGSPATWVQLGSLLSWTDSVPWLFPPQANPFGYDPAGGRLGAKAVAPFLVVLFFGLWLRARVARDRLSLLIAASAVLAVAWAFSRGSLALSRALPVFGAPLLLLAWSGVPMMNWKPLRFAAILFLLTPWWTAVRPLAQEWRSPAGSFRTIHQNLEDGEVNHCLAYRYFNRDKTIDWRQAPWCFGRMTHFIDARLRTPIGCQVVRPRD